MCDLHTPVTTMRSQILNDDSHTHMHTMIEILVEYASNECTDVNCGDGTHEA